MPMTLEQLTLAVEALQATLGNITKMDCGSITKPPMAMYKVALHHGFGPGDDVTVVASGYHDTGGGREPLALHPGVNLRGPTVEILAHRVGGAPPGGGGHVYISWIAMAKA